MTLRPRTRVAAMLLAGLIGATSCGVPIDEQPRVVSATTSTDPGQPESSVSGAERVYVYYVSDDFLVAIREELESDGPEDWILRLLSGAPDDADAAIGSQIPAGTELRSARLVDDTLTIDLSDAFSNLVGTGRTLATAQLVMTATDSPGIGTVRLQIEGKDVKVFSPSRGDVDEVTACDFVSLLPSKDQVAAVDTLPLFRQHTTGRRTTLENRCGSAA